MLRRYQQITNALLAWITAARHADRAEQVQRRAWLPPRVEEGLLGAAAGAATRGVAPLAAAEFSHRLPRGGLVISPRGRYLGALRAGELLVVRGEPSPTAPAHLAWHRLAYETGKAQTCLLAQPPHACCVAATGLEVVGGWTELLPPLPLFRGEPDPGWFLEARGAALVAGAGLLVWGETPDAVVEGACQIEWLCQLALLERGAFAPNSRHLEEILWRPLS